MSSNINQNVLREHLEMLRENIGNAPTHVLHKAVRRHKIEAHNAEIDRKKAQKEKLRQIAKQARLPVEAIQRMVKSVQRTK